MTRLNQTYNVNDLPEGNNFEPIPPGWYNVTIVDVELKETKAGTGEYLAFQFTVDNEQYSNRVIFTNLNISNPSPKAEEIGRRQLGDVARAIGIVTVTDTEDFINKSLLIKDSIKKDDYFGDRNEVKAFKRLENLRAQAPQQSQQSQRQPRQQRQQQAQQQKSTPPW